MKLRELMNHLRRIESLYGGEMEVHFRSTDDEHEIEGVESFHLHNDETKPRLVAIYAPDAE